MVSTCLVIFKSYCPCINPLVTVLRAPIPIGIIVTFMLHSFFISLAWLMYSSLFSHSFNFTLWSAGTATFPIRQLLRLFIFLFFIRSGRLAEIRWSVCISKSLRSLCHSPGQMLGCVYTICSYGQTSTSCTIPDESPCQLCHAKSYTLSVLICCIRLLCHWSFRLHHHIIYICCFFTSYQLSFWYD